LNRETLGAWLAANNLSEDEFRVLMREEAVARRLAMYRIGWDVRRRMPDQLRLNGDYGRASARARHKQQVLGAVGMQQPSLEDVGLSQDALIEWHKEFLERQPDRSPQGQVALSRYARDNSAAFTRAILREFCYSAVVDEPGAPT